MIDILKRRIAAVLFLAALCSNASASSILNVAAVPESTAALDRATVVDSTPTAIGSPRTIARDSAVTTIFLVRHAEKNVAYAGMDPPLSEPGFRRAEALAHVLGDAGIGAIYSTHWRRCKETGLPLAKLLGDSLRIVDQGNFARFARHIRDENPGGRVLVVGHSDTVPQIVEQLTGSKAPSFEGFDVLFVVTLPDRGRPRLTKLHYGAPSAVTP